jgi:hypothetical protein
LLKNNPITLFNLFHADKLTDINHSTPVSLVILSNPNPLAQAAATNLVYR